MKPERSMSRLAKSVFGLLVSSAVVRYYSIRLVNRPTARA
jgi:hypothetical protein